LPLRVHIFQQFAFAGDIKGLFQKKIVFFKLNVIKIFFTFLPLRVHIFQQFAFAGDINGLFSEKNSFFQINFN
jgi:hypothetical protein